MSGVAVVLRSEALEAGVVEAWWQSLVLVGRLLLWYFRVLHQAMYELKVPAAMMAPSVFQRTKSPRTSPGNLPRKLQNGAEAAGQSEPAADSSPGDSISDAENFECFGEADADAPPNTSAENGTRSPGGSQLNRHSWTRTSLRRTPPSHQENLPHRRWGSMRHSGKRQIGSNVLASQLYRSSSFNSSGCGSGGEPADDMYSDVSLEEDVQGLNYKTKAHVPEDLGVILPVRFPKPPCIKHDHLPLKNDFSVTILELPIGEKRSINEIKRRCDELRTSADPLSNHYFIKLVGIFPKAILQSALKSSQATMVLSSMPGPGALSICGGNALKELVFFVPHKGNTGLDVTALCYGGVLRLAASADKSLIPNPEHLSYILDGMVEEIKKLHSQYA